MTSRSISCLRVLGIPASTYYDWRARRPRRRGGPARMRELLGMIDEIRGEHEFAATYGSPRVWLELRRRGVRVGRKRVERIMREHRPPGRLPAQGLEGGSTRQNPRHTAAPDLLDRDFTATAPNQQVGRRPDPHPHRRGGAVAGQRARCVLQQGGRLGQRPARDHRPGALGARLRDLVPRCPRRAADPPQRQGVPIHRGSVHPAPRRRRHRALHRQRRR